MRCCAIAKWLAKIHHMKMMAIKSKSFDRLVHGAKEFWRLEKGERNDFY